MEWQVSGKLKKYLVERPCRMCGNVGTKDEFCLGVDKERAASDRKAMDAHHRWEVGRWDKEWSSWWGRDEKYRAANSAFAPKATPPKHGPYRYDYGRRWIDGEEKPNRIRRECLRCGWHWHEIALDEGDWK